jgi:putative transposase
MSSSLPQRKRLRHEGYDYRKPGAYFVTLCIEDSLSLLGQANQDAIALSSAGNMVTDVWHALPNTFPAVNLDMHVVMPNHIHFIIWLNASIPQQNAVIREEPNDLTEVKNTNPSLPDVMQWFKSLTTAKYRHGVHALDWPVFPGKLWQRSYYEHVVRSDAALYAIRRYIQNNPQRWHLDRYHPDPVGPDEEATALWRLLQNEDIPP